MKHPMIMRARSNLVNDELWCFVTEISGIGWGTRIRTWTNRIRICGSTVNLFPNRKRIGNALYALFQA